MIVQCKSCQKKFLVSENVIPKEGMEVQCGVCSSTWFQKPEIKKKSKPKSKKITQEKIETASDGKIETASDGKIETASDGKIETASDGKKYKFLGKQWALVLPSGKAGRLAKSHIKKELDEKIGRSIDPSVESMSIATSEKDEKNKGIGFLTSIFIILIGAISAIGVLETFKNELAVYWPELESYLEYVYETLMNIRTILRDLFYSY